MFGRDRVFTRSFSVSSESDAIKERLDLEMVVVTEQAEFTLVTSIRLYSLPLPQLKHPRWRRNPNPARAPTIVCPYCLLWCLSLRYTSTDERLLAAARADNEDLLLEVFEQGGFDINFQDGLVQPYCA